MAAARRHFAPRFGPFGTAGLLIGTLLLIDFVVRPGNGLQADVTSEQMWILRQMTARGQEVALPAAPKLSISFSSEGVVAGNSGINLYSAGYRRTGEAITWTTPFRSTRRGGAKELQELETAFLKILQNCTAITEQGAMTLSGKEGRLTFEREPARE